MDLRSWAGGILEPFARSVPFSPNAITAVALAFNLAAAVTLGLASASRSLWLVAVLLAAIGGLLDLLDGVVARSKNLTSAWGDFLDHFCDRVSDSALMAGWVIGAGVVPPLAIIAVASVMLNGYAGTQVEATFRRREYSTVGRGQYYLAILVLPVLAWLFDARMRAPLAGRFSAADLITAFIVLAAVYGVLQRVRVARRFASEDAGRNP